ncbi:RsmF rRNA methyltransferase first C-terminal domain-containing protein [Paenibacillus sp. P25]|nr:RsmF rRNA methyltransferase first C-terminal domain-containing protein [Paenibacillus sp. P25]
MPAGRRRPARRGCGRTACRAKATTPRCCGTGAARRRRKRRHRRRGNATRPCGRSRGPAARSAWRGAEAAPRVPPAAQAAAATADPREALRRFAAEQLAAEPYAGAALECRGEHVYAAPPGSPELDRIRVIRPGWYLGGVNKQRFVPSHALALGLRAEEALRRVSFTAGDPRAVRYLKGETLELAPEDLHTAAADVPLKGYVLVCVDGFPAGWGRWQDGLLKNDYPPGWRWT